MKKFWIWAATFWRNRVRLRTKFGGYDQPDFAYDTTNDIQDWLDKKAALKNEPTQKERKS